MARHCALIPGVTGVVGHGLAEYLAAHNDWEVIGVARRVPPGPLNYPVIYGDFNFLRGYDVMSDTLKLRQTGFGDCIDTGRMFLEHFAYFRQERIIP